MKRSLKLTYICVFLGLLLGLSLWSIRDILSFSTAADTPILNGKLAHAFEKHYDDQFVLKKLGTNIWATMDFLLFGEGRPGVVVGRQDWLFTDEEFKPAPQGDVLQKNWQLIEAVHAELNRRGVTLVLALLPAKARLYQEHVGDVQPVAAQQQLYGKAFARMQARKVLGPNLFGALLRAKAHGSVFLRTDTHWTPFGAETVANSLAHYLEATGQWQPGVAAFVTEEQGRELYKGDLLSFLPMDPYFLSLQPPAETLVQRSTRPVGEALEGDAALFGEALPEVALVGTSYSANPKWNFAGALKQALRSELVNYAEGGHGPLLPMLKLLQRGEAETATLKLLIWEFPERYLMQPNDLSGFDPVWLQRLTSAVTDSEHLAVRQPFTPVVRD
ncbi:alginate O-acetyltransferase [Pseudomonas cavernicola]|uniref:Probable alginate O-acetylase AlgJ n=1 Tax=Pseudomonas cavernicola TaxID=2320866 RepID=A0A418XB48_9PSED|nr:alginate O-acetyltransferase [Pseudomonas cavernicola]RJG09704.1 alginate O-acetyltransferase [Pseudomonas cavernicola]